MANLKLKESLEEKAREDGNVTFGQVVVANIRPIVNGTYAHLRAAWWQGFLTAAVSTMRLSIGDKGARDVLERLK